MITQEIRGEHDVFHFPRIELHTNPDPANLFYWASGGKFPRRKGAGCTPHIIKHMVYYQCDRNEITGHLEACLPIISTMTTAL